MGASSVLDTKVRVCSQMIRFNVRASTLKRVDEAKSWCFVAFVIDGSGGGGVGCCDVTISTEVKSDVGRRH